MIPFRLTIPLRQVCHIALAATVLSLPALSVDAGERSARANYLLRCSGCHGTDGTGHAKAGIPPFPGFIAPLLADDAGRTYAMHVPGVVASSLDDPEIALVMNYVLATWGGSVPAQPFTTEEVTRRRALPMPDLIAYRRAIVDRLEKQGIALAEYPWP